MIEACFKRSRGELCGFSVSGHSGYDYEGRDIVCASVSSAVMMTCNAMTEIFKVDAEIAADGNVISAKVGKSNDGRKLIEALKLHLEALAEDYPENITFKISEV